MPRTPDPYEFRGQPRPIEDTQRVWRSMGWEQPTLFDALKETEVSARMWTIKPSPEQALRMGQDADNIRYVIQRMKDFPAEQQEIGVVGLSRMINDLETLLRMNTRLMVCYAVEAGILSEGQGARHLGLDRVTFREIKDAARVWAERVEKGTNGEGAPLAGVAAGGSAGEPAQAGVAGDGQGVGGRGEEPGPPTP